MICTLCGTRRARRGCPALSQQICAVCCGTKRLVQIPCPSDCAYLTTSREHPPAAVLRQQQRDIGLLVQGMRGLSERQSQLFVLINGFLKRYEPPELQALVDDDVVEAMAALARSFETAARGVIYDHRPAAMPADRLATALKQVLAQAAKREGSAFDRDVAVVLRRIEEAAREIKFADASNRHAYLDLLGRVLKEDQGPDAADGQVPRLIVP